MVDYKKYKVWQRSHKLVLAIYEVTKKFPKTKQFGLVSPMNRATISVPANIAEGCGRETQKELIRFLYLSSGSARELHYLLLVSKELVFLVDEKAEDLIQEIDEIKKMIAAFIITIKRPL